eukprot:TRINITY_DN5126_c0_g1_i1.p1 TRINITY_DN5126_c0_g1~~TRINITY_DN5126_c0_g1_i1.p1  ORF type:complete len:238 (+),score=57.54 TRINITY_DN5126_c0_g1_i1:90-803(+)
MTAAGVTQLDSLEVRRSSSDGGHDIMDVGGDDDRICHSERDKGFMREALKEAELAYNEGEVPVGCVFVKDETIIGRGHNRTNLKKNATAHAELEAIDEALNDYGLGNDGDNDQLSVFRGAELYVTVEPCVMCASALLRLGLKKVYFGCHNDRFGGCGSIYSIHNTIPSSTWSSSTSTSSDSQTVTTVVGDEVFAYECVTGVLKEEAIHLLRKFYARENTNAPPTKRRPKGGGSSNDD